MAEYWFPAKRYGWGWGLPTAWQGWLVFVGYILLLVVGAFLFPPREALAAYLTYVAALSARSSACAGSKANRHGGAGVRIDLPNEVIQTKAVRLTDH
jgi:hypothetical protein